VLAAPQAVSHLVPFALQARGWTRDVTVFTNAAVELPEEARAALATAEIRVEPAPIARLVGAGGRLEAIELEGGARVPCEALFAHPPQRQVELVRGLGVALDEAGYVAVDPMTRETSIAGIYAAGDLTTRMQGAIVAAAAGTPAAAKINVDLAMALAHARAA
jgi:thioredoxin reductase